MFTSRAEYRILLRNDNADIRLTELSNKIGLASEERLKNVTHKIKETDALVNFIKTTSVEPDKLNPILAEIDSAPIKQKMKMDNILTRPGMHIGQIKRGSAPLKTYLEDKQFDTAEVEEQAELLIKYAGYIDREREVAEKIERLEYVKIPNDIDYNKFSTFSNESKEKLKKIKPATIGQASRISGIKPSDVSVLLIHVGR
jgi:tRNA uridine 5-carboxymethylaminomethyl modification enzyme